MSHVHLTEPSLDFFSRVYLQCRGGALPLAPMIVSWNDSAINPGRAAGRALMKFVILSVPYAIRADATGRVPGRTWDEAREPYADYLIDLITAGYIPDLKAKIIKRVAHSPWTLHEGSRVPFGERWGTARSCASKRRSGLFQSSATTAPPSPMSICAAPGAIPVRAFRWHREEMRP